VSNRILSCRRLAVCLTGGLGLAAALLAGPTAAAQKGKVTVDKLEYKGWKNNLQIGNGEAELIVTLDVGPRIISYRLAGGKNVFKEYEDQLGKSGEKEWQIRGGHRLWAAPEDSARTYWPDNGPVKYTALEGGGARFTPAPESTLGLQKEIDVKLASTGSQVTLVHRITNVGQQATELAPWALSVMAPGGVEVIPLPPKRPHPGSPQNAKSPADWAPTLSMTMWSYFDFKDPRYDFGSKYITLRHDPKRGPTKIGLAHRLGWVGYLNGGTLFVKRFAYQEGKTYPDSGVNYETFTNEDMLELETLGPLVRLAPGEKLEHIEHWELIKDVPEFKDEAGIDRNILPRVTAR
jgi:hypothetical protein